MNIKISKYNFQEGLKDNIDYLLEEQKVEILEEIILIMEKKSITRAELARRLGTTRAYITKLFRMNINFTIESLVKIAHSVGSKISIHFHQPEAIPIWFDLCKEYKEAAPIKLDKYFTSDKELTKKRYIQPGGTNYEQSAIAA
ncbi:hypothetical protein ES703_64509 [subsurface metagenome]